MNRKDYIDEVMHYIVDKGNKPLIVEEINNHIDDRTERYIELGYHADKAEEMAVDHMGDARDLGVQMSRLYDKKIRRSEMFFSFVMAGIWIFDVVINFNSYSSCIDWKCIVFEFLLLGGAFVFVLNSIRYRSAFISAMSVALQIANIVIITIKNGGRFVSCMLIYLFYGIRGELGNIKALADSGVQVIVGNRLVAFSVIFYVITTLLLVANFVLVIKSKGCKFSKKAMRIHKAVAIFGLSVLLIGLVLSVVSLIFGFSTVKNNNDNSYDYLSLVYSDSTDNNYYFDNNSEEFDVFLWEDYSQEQLNKHIDYFGDKFTISKQEVELDNDISFIAKTYDITVNPQNEKYVCLAKLKIKSGWTYEGEAEYDQLSVSPWQSADDFCFVEDTGYVKYVIHS